MRFFESFSENKKMSKSKYSSDEESNDDVTSTFNLDLSIKKLFKLNRRWWRSEKKTHPLMLNLGNESYTVSKIFQENPDGGRFVELSKYILPFSSQNGATRIHRSKVQLQRVYISFLVLREDSDKLYKAFLSSKSIGFERVKFSTELVESNDTFKKLSVNIGTPNQRVNVTCKIDTVKETCETCTNVWSCSESNDNYFNELEGLSNVLGNIPGKYEQFDQWELVYKYWGNSKSIVRFPEGFTQSKKASSLDHVLGRLLKVLR